ncbi:hypothetical protein [Thermosynechococcus sp. M55_K2018_012]|uniref:hypothetical protein n=1 Tax=Thermosynechococcus sp. M55_K2018_012 TaxID=2747809 RepID=UPI0019DF0BAB|nr:hypothetical protein [Thermosynechococcus sp. M55_K2018_012]HIK47266.1 hypothetical protein [Thermosynechococcus sp. M55_K2018_012]
MTVDRRLMQAIETLGYRVTAGDVAGTVGLPLQTAEKGLMALAADVGGTLQVAESGDIAYVFPRNFRSILQAKYWQLRLRAMAQRVWGVVFYLIRISFGIFLIVSIILIFLAIAIILIALSSQGRDGDDRGQGSSWGGGGINFWVFPDFWYFFGDPSPQRSRPRSQDNDEEMNFFEGVYSFLFGDGNPNADLEERRWQLIGQVIRNNGGVVTAEQIAPYLDLETDAGDDEWYMLPVLTRFNGRPEVTETGQIIYRFPELQTTAQTRKGQRQTLPPILEEHRWRFSRAPAWQIMVAIGLGCVNLIGALMLWYLLGDGAIAQELGGLVAFVASIFWILLGYGIGFLGIPLGRYYWLLWQNQRIRDRNARRYHYANILANPTPQLRAKLRAAQAYAQQRQIREQDVIYRSDQDLVEQELAQSEAIDREWLRRLESE